MSSPSQPTIDVDDEPGPPTSDFIAGRYQVIRELGVGGMGIVYLAYDKTAARNVALKRMRSIGSGFRERFRREYRALAAVRHTGVPAIYDIGEAGGPFFTMEIIAGETIRDLLKRGPLKPARAVALAIELGRVLMAVHAVGVIHRDVKPSNIIVEDGDRVRLIDFGACLLTPDYYKLPHLRDITAAGKRWHTSEHEYIGCAPYTCPRYWSEGLVAPQSDVFSVCVVLYEMLTGRALYSKAGGFRTISADEFPPELAPLVPQLMRGLAEPEDRHATMADLVRGLEIVRSKLVATSRAGAGIIAVASVTSFLLGMALSAAVPKDIPLNNPPVAAGPSDTSSTALAASPRTAVAAGSDDSLNTLIASVPSNTSSAPVPAGPTDKPSTPIAPASPGAASSEGAAAPSKPRRSAPLSWDERLRKAEARARECLEKAGLAVAPRLTTIPAGEPARVRGVASDSREASCIREALDRFGVRVAEGQRQHTFFAL